MSADTELALVRMGLGLPATGGFAAAASFRRRLDKSLAPLIIAAVLGTIAAVTFLAGFLAITAEHPTVWIHRLVALALSEAILFAGLSMKLLPLLERSRYSVRILADPPPLPATALNFDELPPVPQPPPVVKPIAVGQLAGREYIGHSDGTIEIDTLLGRRRFVSLDAAREFVGA